MLTIHTTLSTRKRFIQWIALSTVRTTKVGLIQNKSQLCATGTHSPLSILFEEKSYCSSWRKIHSGFSIEMESAQTVPHPLPLLHSPRGPSHVFARPRSLQLLPHVALNTANMGCVKQWSRSLTFSPHCSLQVSHFRRSQGDNLSTVNERKEREQVFSN